MAETVGQHSVAAFTSPVNGTTPIDANTVRGNDNTVRSAYVDHDADPGIHVQSSSLASRPVAGTAGRKWITVSSGRYQLWYDDGARWNEVASDAINVDCLADANLTKGDVVKITGFNNGQNLPTVNKVTASTDTAFGVVENTVTSGNLVQIVNTGLIEDVDTNGYAVGTILYPNTSGGWTTTKPTSGNYQPAGFVLRGNTNNGVLYVEFSAPRIVERSDNTASTIVLRDASGNFSAGTITAGALTSTGLVTFASLKGTGATTVTNILDEDNMASDSATALATQQSIKAYVDAQVATVDTLAEVLANGNTTGANNIIVTNGQKITTNTIDETTAAAGVTIDSVLLKDNAVTATTFNGTLNGAAPAGSLSGTTLASNVVSSSLTSVGTLANLTVTNPISGSVTGSSGSTTGNAATATALQTARNINGVSFNGTADITVTAAAGTLTGTTLASGVTASSLTSVGTLTSLTVSGNTSLASSSGGVGIGAAAGSSKLNVAGTFTKNTGDENTWGIRVTDETAMTTGVGGGLVFVGNYTSGGGKASFASIAGAKANSTTGNGLGELRFYTTDASSILQQRAVIDGAGNLAVDTNTLYVDAANNRVGIGLTNPGTALDITGASGTTAATVRLINSGTAAGDYAIYQLKQGTGSTWQMFTGANSDTLTFGRSGVADYLYLTNSGNLGLGVTPSAWISTWRALQTLGGALAGASDRQLVMQNCFVDSGGNTKYVADGFASFYRQTSGQHQFFTAASGLAGNNLTANTQAMTLDASGHLSVVGGASVAGSQSGYAGGELRLGPTTSAADSAISTQAAGAAGMFFDHRATSNTGYWTWRNGTGGANTRMTLDASGNLGVGTATPTLSATATGIDVYDATDPQIRLHNSTGTGTSDGVVFSLGSGGEVYLFGYENQPMIFGTNGAERARITSGGFFKASNDGTYIGSTAPYHEFCTTTGDNAAVRVEHSSSSTPYGVEVLFTAGSPDNNTNYFARYADSTTLRCIIYSDGDIQNHDGVYGTISDERLKQDIADAGSQWDDLKAVRFRKYRFKSDVEKNPDAPHLLGVVAQELEQTSPGLVDETPEYEDREVTDEDGNVTTERVQVGTTKTVKSSILLMKAAVALQEAMARIETLEAHSAALEARLEALEA